MKIQLKSIVLIFLFSTLFISCDKPKKYIIETDYTQLLPDTINGETQEESNKKIKKFGEELISNTINRTIPDIEIFSDEGVKLNLRNILHKETIIISSDTHCGWGLECLTNDFPKAVNQLQSDLQNIDIICLLKRENSDIENSDAFNQNVNDLKKLYKKVYIIEENEARKINLFPNPTRLYVNNYKIVKHIEFGTSLVENRLLNEIKENTGIPLIQ